MSIGAIDICDEYRYTQPLLLLTDISLREIQCLSGLYSALWNLVNFERIRRKTEGSITVAQGDKLIRVLLNMKVNKYVRENIFQY